MSQGDGKTLKDYMNRFSTAVQDQEESDESSIMMNLLNGLRGTYFPIKLIDNKVKTISETMHRAQGAINIEEFLVPKFKQALQRQKGMVGE